jgi:hypothetical protein
MGLMAGKHASVRPRSLRIAWSLIRIPHLTLSLFAFPLLLGLVVILVQSFFTAMVITASARDISSEPHDEGDTSPGQEDTMTRLILFGDGKKRPDLLVCRWREVDGEEEPPSVECQPDRLDVAIHVSDPQSFDPAPYVRMFSGNVDRIHLCTTCQPDVVIKAFDGEKPTVHSYSVFGALLALSPYWSTEINREHKKAFKMRGDVKKQLGIHLLHLPETPSGIQVSQLGSSLPLALNVTLFVIVALWLALRAHRKVLDYFAQNEVLLPLVAACGRGPFYGALWLLTGFRVISFLVAGIVMVLVGFFAVFKKGLQPLLVGGFSGSLLWIAALVTTLGLATLLASVAELRRREHILTSLLKWVPIVLAVAGGIVWSFSLLLPADSGSYVRAAVSAIPIVGMVPILVAPVLNVPSFILAFHALAAGLGCVSVARRNAQWFAAHLDEI